MYERGKALKFFAKMGRYLIISATYLLLVSEHGLAMGASQIKCPSEIKTSDARTLYKEWGFYDQGPGKLSGAWIQRLGDHYEETPDPVKTVRSESAEIKKTTDFYRLTSWFGEPWTLRCEYGGRVRENTHLWHDLPRLFAACEITETHTKAGKEFEAYCK
jgi:hypothetical protein